MKYLSLCSGIEAATTAWHPLGWEPVAFSEIEKFPSAVLSHHYPNTPNLGDMTKFSDWPDYAINLLVGGTPCQSFSVAGLRKGLSDPRGNLMLTFGAIAARYRPEWVVWENVPGVLGSEGGRDFACFLGLLTGQTVEVPADGWKSSGVVSGIDSAYGVAYRVLDAQYVRVESHPGAVPQRRRRVFVVGHLGDWRRAAAVLFERESLCWNPAPSRHAGQIPAPTLAIRARGGGGLGTDFDCDGGLIAAHVANDGVFHMAKGGDPATDNYVAQVAQTVTSDMHRSGGAVAGNNDQDVRNCIVAPFDTTQITSKANYSNPKAGGPCHPLLSGAHPPAIAIRTAQTSANGHGISEEAAHTLDGAQGQAIAIQSGALRENPNSGSDGVGVQEGVAYTVEARSEVQAVQSKHAVRRLTPCECERLQGFPDDYTRIPSSLMKKLGVEDAADPDNDKHWSADGPRYKALGNSMAVNVMRWIGERIAMVESETQ